KRSSTPICSAMIFGGRRSACSREGWSITGTLGATLMYCPVCCLLKMTNVSWQRACIERCNLLIILSIIIIWMGLVKRDPLIGGMLLENYIIIYNYWGMLQKIASIFLMNQLSVTWESISVVRM